jgi:hypothetical protein
MKKLFLLFCIATTSVFSLAGCGTDFRVGGGSKTIHQHATIGQQLVDLQKAKEAGAINEAEFQTQKAKLLAN